MGENKLQLALKTAELDKNCRLSWMLKPRRLEIAATESVNLQSAQADFVPVEAVSTAQSHLLPYLVAGFDGCEVGTVVSADVGAVVVGG
ncbi:MAG: hypothetical protein WBB29_09595 [Geitlerinemataceae cyanobacterium]